MSLSFLLFRLNLIPSELFPSTRCYQKAPRLYSSRLLNVTVQAGVSASYYLILNEPVVPSFVTFSHLKKVSKKYFSWRRSKASCGFFLNVCLTVSKRWAFMWAKSQGVKSGDVWWVRNGGHIVLGQYLLSLKCERMPFQEQYKLSRITIHNWRVYQSRSKQKLQEIVSALR